MKRTRSISGGLVGVASLCLGLVSAGRAQSASAPVLVELFTSEGCSSCPPADALLAQLASSNAHVIALSEHVNYWNQLGWTDPFSSTASTERQYAYARRFGGEGPYTPQMVVNGTEQFVGSDRGAAEHAIAAAERSAPTVALHVDEAISGKDGSLAARVRMDASSEDGELIEALVQDAAHSDVLRGENGGRVLRHVDVARVFLPPVHVRRGAGYQGTATFALPPGTRPADVHVVVFFERGAGGKVLAAASSAQPR